MNNSRALLKSLQTRISVQQFAMLSCLALVAGSASLLIGWHGSPTPISDQWDLEAANLYKPYLEGRLEFLSLFNPHNEHRMFFTRLFALALFELRGGWDPIWAMTIDIAFRLLAISLLLVLLNRLLSATEAVAVAIVCALVFATPFAWETILMGYPFSFYLLLMFSFGSFLLLHGSAAWSARWWIGTLLGVCAYFNVASGVFTLLAADCIICLQIIFGMRRGIREWAGLALHLALVIAMMLAVPTVEDHAQLRAQSLVQFAGALAAAMAWPLTPPFWVLLYGPSVIFAGLLVMQRPAIKDARWTYLMLLAWLVLQLAALAYRRAVSPLDSRYLDTLGVGVVLNFAMLLYLCRRSPARGAFLAYALAACWVMAVCVAGIEQASTVFSRPLVTRTQTQTLKAFLDTNDASVLACPGECLDWSRHIPYPDPDRLIKLLSDPVIRNILPSDLVGDEPGRQFVQPRTYLRGALSKTAVKLRDWILHNGYTFIAIGLASLILALMRIEFERRASPPDG